MTEKDHIEFLSRLEDLVKKFGFIESIQSSFSPSQNMGNLLADGPDGEIFIHYKIQKDKNPDFEENQTND